MMTALSKATFAGITYGVMGLGTEGGATPYKITVAANGPNGGWQGTVIRDSGYSVGAMQFDFGQRGRTNNPLSGTKYSESFVEAVNDWASQNGQPLLSTAVITKLESKGSSIKWMTDAERSTISAFGATDHGQNWVNTNLEKGLIAEYEPKVSAVLNNPIFNKWNESDIIVASAVLSKAQNQSPYNGFNKLTSKIYAAKEGYSIDDFMADTKSVEANNSDKKWDFSKSGEIAKEYVKLRESPEIGPIIEAAEAKIASNDFKPSSVNSDSDIWLLKKVNTDSKFRSDLNAAVERIEAGETGASENGGKSNKSTIIIDPEKDYLEIQSPGKGESVIIKNNEPYFYMSGDTATRELILNILDNPPALPQTPSSSANGHWQDVPAQHDPITGVETAPATKVWVAPTKVSQDGTGMEGQFASVAGKTVYIDEQGRMFEPDLSGKAQPKEVILGTDGKGNVILRPVEPLSDSMSADAVPAGGTQHKIAVGMLAANLKAGGNGLNSELELLTPEQAKTALILESSSALPNNNSNHQQTDEADQFYNGSGSQPTPPANPFANKGITAGQQTVLADQLSAQGINPATTQLIPLASGGYLIANTEGELVGSTTPVGSSGLQSFTNASGQTTLLAPSGSAMTAAQAAVYESTGIDLATPISTLYNPEIQGALSGMNAGAALSNAFTNWGNLSDMQRASALLAAYNSASQLASSGTTIINADGTQSPFTPPPPGLAAQAAGVVNLLVSVQSLGNWSHMSDIQHSQALVGVLSSGNAALQSFGSGDAGFGQGLGQIGAGLSFMSALNHGDGRAILTSGLQLLIRNS